MNDQLIRLLVKQIEQVWSGTLCSGPPYLNARFEFMKSEAQIGDLVLIDHTPRNVDLLRIGWLDEIGTQPFPNQNPEDWAPEEIPKERYWQIETLHDGRLFKWTNVSVLRVFNEDGLDHTLSPVRKL